MAGRLRTIPGDAETFTACCGTFALCGKTLTGPGGTFPERGGTFTGAMAAFPPPTRTIRAPARTFAGGAKTFAKPEETFKVCKKTFRVRCISSRLRHCQRNKTQVGDNGIAGRIFPVSALENRRKSAADALQLEERFPDPSEAKGQGGPLSPVNWARDRRNHGAGDLGGADRPQTGVERGIDTPHVPTCFVRSEPIGVFQMPGFEGLTYRAHALFRRTRSDRHVPRSSAAVDGSGTPVLILVSKAPITPV